MKNETFSRFGGRDLQLGRQKTPVVLTATKKTPLKAESRRRTASHIVSASRSGTALAGAVWGMTVNMGRTPGICLRTISYDDCVAPELRSLRCNFLLRKRR